MADCNKGILSPLGYIAQLLMVFWGSDSYFFAISLFLALN